MLVSIGRRTTPDSEDLVGLLLECHERIRKFAALATELGRRNDLPPAEVVDASDRCARYFGEALPLHVADEEQSVLPRLRAASLDGDAALAEMLAQHADHGPRLTTLLSALRSLRDRPTDERTRETLRSIAEPLEAALERHLDLEERAIFPVIRTRLSSDDQRRAVAELRARRRP